jgi:putative phosphoesterase
MRVVIVSDSHDNIINIDKMLKYVNGEKIKTMLHCGDVCAPAVLKYFAEKFKGDIYHVYGNVDGDREMMEKISQEFKDMYLLGDKGTPKIYGLKYKIGMVHYPDMAKEMAKSRNYDIVFYGHDHKPWIANIEIKDKKTGKKKVQLVNPGTLAGLFQKATFAVWDTDKNKLELKILENL